MNAASPPVATMHGGAVSSRSMDSTMARIMPRYPVTAPTCMASTVDLPMAELGSARSILGSRAVRLARFSVMVIMPGAMTPPR